RLAKQYAMKKGIYGWSDAVPDIIDLSRIENVIDIAAGTCIWTFDFADMPQIRARRDAVHIYACDINTGFFPETTLMEAKGITAFEQDVTKPFAEEYQGKFDLIHVACLVICLTEEGWVSALGNFAKILKPGGIVLMDEADPVFFSNKQSLPAFDAVGYNLSEYMDGTSWVHKANCLYTGFSLQNGFVVGLTFRLGAMLEHAGFTVEKSERAAVTFGKLCRSETGLDGGSLVTYEEFSLRNLEFILAHVARGMLQKGTLEVPRGKIVTREEDMKETLQEIQAGLREDGAIVLGAYFVARKKSE
ncbi:hypothetical protein K438DRAFT_1557844, partial [Mycena galopus ATCC 62051]